MKRLMMLLVVAALVALAGQASADLDAGLVAYYPFNGNADDGSGSGNHGTVHGATLTEDRFGDPNSAYRFDGNDYIDIGNDETINIAGSFTLSAWVKVGDPQDFILDEYAIVGKMGASGWVDDQFVLEVSKIHRGIRLIAYNPGNLLWPIDTWPADQWVHISGTYDAVTKVARIYLSGSFKAEDAFTNPVFKTNINVTIGATPNDFNRRLLVGSLDDVRIYNRALAECEIQALAGVGTCVIPVEIDIKPGSDPNSINLKSKGVVPVAALTTEEFDASTVGPNTVAFAGAEPVRCTMEDVDGDGDTDLLLHFRTQDLDLDENSTEATLTGETTDGMPIEGTDSVNIVPKGKGKPIVPDAESSTWGQIKRQK